MPDEPTSRAGDADASSAATFTGRVERVDATTGGVPPIPPRQPVARPADGPTAGSTTGQTTATSSSPARTRGGARARKVRRIVRHIDPWSVLKISVLFYAALFLIVCVASGLLWGVARGAGTVDNVESFITSVGGFGNCEPIDGATPSATTTTLPGVAPTGPVDQLDPGADPTATTPDAVDATPGADEDCRPGEQLVGEFRFQDARIFEAFALGGIVLVLAGSAANVVMVLLFNLMSDLTGGVRVTVLEEDTPARAASGSPKRKRRG